MTKDNRMTRRALLLGGGSLISAGVLAWLQKSRLRSAYHTFREAYLKPESKLTAFDRLDNETHFDVCIIGSGPAGAILGTELARKGIKTLILESGVGPDNQEMVGQIRKLEVYESEGPLDYPLASTRIRMLGGTSAIWTGRCSRLHPIDFEKNAYTPPDNPWPISYADLEPYYARAEQTLRVTGHPLSRFHAPRNTPLPLESNLDLSTLQTLLSQVDVVVDESPTSVGLWDDGGPIRILTDFLPEFSDMAAATLVSGATATRLLVNPAGRVTGVELHSLAMEKKTIQADQVIVACGAIESARLLLLSQTDALPGNIGINSDEIGRNFMEHPSIIFKGNIPVQDQTPPYYQIGRCHQFYDSLKNEGFGSAILFFYWDPNHPEILQIGATLEMKPNPDNRIRLSADKVDLFGSPTADLVFSYSPEDEETMQAVQVLIRELYAGLQATDVEVNPDAQWSHHHLGSCRMGSDPATSVVDENLRVHGTENLYVLSSAAFVTGGAAHPTLAITALAHRLGDHLQQTVG